MTEARVGGRLTHFRGMKCEACPAKAHHAERRGFAIRYMCGDCYALSDEEFDKKLNKKKLPQVLST